MNSILTSIKKLLGIAEEQTNFDADITMHINSVFSVLAQLGVGAASGYEISGDTDTWEDFIDDTKNLSLIKSYIYLKVKLMFDPPINGSVLESINKQIAEMEWRINVVAETEGWPTRQQVSELEEDINDLDDRLDEHDDLFKILVGDDNA